MLIKEELPLSESFPYTYNPNRSKYFYTNAELNNENNINFDILISDIEEQMKKFKNLPTVVIFDNISTLPNDNLYDSLSNMFKKLSDNVYRYCL